jgi:1-deoxy-D-xylulose-5-phosphate synthase
VEVKRVGVLEGIDSPERLKQLSAEERQVLAEEIRQEIILTVSQTGGHLASNLGIVELALAIHTVYDSPEDKIVWDVSHQCYPHKLLTGRKPEFHTLRQPGGLSGFVKPEESPHDAFVAGHASTSISAALGLAKARDLRKGNEHVVAVIGDGSMTGGLALEGLNNAKDLNTNITVVLNDNKMSIAENVGALALHLSKLRLQPLYQRMENRAKEAVRKLPVGSKTIAKTAEGIYHGVTHLMAAETGVLFEEMGFKYIGPIDGHNTELVIEVLQQAKRLSGPVMVHVHTTKGKGYEFAENNARDFHGISGFTIEDGKIEKSAGNASYTKVFADTVVDLAKEDPRIVTITAAMPDGTGLAKFAKEFPGRFYDVGIAEGHAVTFAAGLAAGGFRPVVAVYSTFLQRAYDQIVHDICLQNLPVVFAIDCAGIVGEDGPTHHGVFDMSFLRHIPCMSVMAPKDTNELRDMLATALKHDGPIAIRYPRGSGPTAYEALTPQTLTIGSGEILRSGDDAAIIAVGSAVKPAVDASDLLADKSVGARVINARFVKPLDEELIISAARECKTLVVAEENALAGGFGSAILELLCLRGIHDVKVKRIGISDRFVDQGDPEALRSSMGLSANKLAEAVEDLILVRQPF